MESKNIKNDLSLCDRLSRRPVLAFSCLIGLAATAAATVAVIKYSVKSVIRADGEDERYAKHRQGIQCKPYIDEAVKHVKPPGDNHVRASKEIVDLISGQLRNDNFTKNMTKSTVLCRLNYGLLSGIWDENTIIYNERALLFYVNEDVATSPEVTCAEEKDRKYEKPGGGARYVIIQNTSNRLGVILFEKPIFDSSRVSSIADKKPELGDPVFKVVRKNGIDDVQAGVLISKYPQQPESTIVTSIPGYDSSGPTFDQAGKFLGFSSRHDIDITRPKNYVQFVTEQDAADLLKQAEEALKALPPIPEKKDSPQPVPPIQKVEKIEDSSKGVVKKHQKSTTRKIQRSLGIPTYK